MLESEDLRDWLFGVLSDCGLTEEVVVIPKATDLRFVVGDLEAGEVEDDKLFMCSSTVKDKLFGVFASSLLLMSLLLLLLLLMLE